MSALNPQTLLDSVACYACYGLSQAELFKLALLDMIVQGLTPVTDSFRITQASDFRITQAGDSRIIQ